MTGDDFLSNLYKGLIGFVRDRIGTVATVLVTATISIGVSFYCQGRPLTPLEITWLVGLLAFVGFVAVFFASINHILKLNESRHSQFISDNQNALEYLEEYKDIFTHNDSLPKDISTKYLKKTIIFGEDFVDGFTNVIVERELANHMDSEYKNYRLHVTSPDYVPIYDDIRFYINDELVKKEKSNITKKLTANYEIEFSGGLLEDIKLKKLNDITKIIYYQIDLKPRKSTKLTFKYNTSAFKGALKEMDSCTQIITRKIENLRFELIISDENKGKYKFEPGSKLNQSGIYETIDFEIHDESNQKMVKSEGKLKDNNQIPIMSDNKVYWEIKNPKLGYKYTLLFRLSNISKK